MQLTLVPSPCLDPASIKSENILHPRWDCGLEHHLQRHKDSGGGVPIISPCSSPAWLLQKPDGLWQMTVNYCKLSEVHSPIIVAVSGAAVYWNRSTPLWELPRATDLVNRFFSMPMIKWMKGSLPLYGKDHITH